MSSLSNSKIDISNINANEKIAIIYSLEHLGSYLIEIKHHNTSYYINHRGDPIIYNSLDNAKEASKKEGATLAFLALSKTFEEVDMMTDFPQHKSTHYDYLPLDL